MNYDKHLQRDIWKTLILTLIWECQAASAQEQTTGATPHPSQGGGREELPHTQGRGGGREELPHARGRGSGREELPHQLAIVTQMTGRIMQLSWQLSSRWQAGIVQLSWQLSSKWEDSNHAAQQVGFPAPKDKVGVNHHCPLLGALILMIYFASSSCVYISYILIPCINIYVKFNPLFSLHSKSASNKCP